MQIFVKKLILFCFEAFINIFGCRLLLYIGGWCCSQVSDRLCSVQYWCRNNALQIDLLHIHANQNQSSEEGADHVEQGIDLTEYYINVEWDILRVPAERHVKVYACCPEPYPGNGKFLLRGGVQFNIELIYF